MPRALITGDFGIEEPLRVIPPKPRGVRRAWYKPNHRSFGAFMRSEQMRDVTTEVAKDVAVAATENAPPPSGDSDAASATYEVKREAGIIKVSGNLRVKVEVVGKGREAERAEFAHRSGEGRYRNLARTASGFGDWKPLD